MDRFIKYGFVLALETFILSNYVLKADQKSQNFMPNLSQEPQDLEITCQEYPYLVNDIIALGKRMGVSIKRGKPLMPNKDATYLARNGQLGSITISPKMMSQESYCALVTHEFIHVLQHLNGGLNAVEPLGLKLPPGSVKRYGSIQEAEAYTYQNRASEVLGSLQKALKIKK